MLATIIMLLTVLFLPRLLVLATDKAPFLNSLGSVSCAIWRGFC